MPLHPDISVALEGSPYLRDIAMFCMPMTLQDIVIYSLFDYVTRTLELVTPLRTIHGPITW